jgi:hypothetical protein
VPRHAVTLLVAVLATAALSATALAAASTPPKAARSDRNGLIAYVGPGRVIGIYPDDRPNRALTGTCKIRDCDWTGMLAWSPDGRRLAFVQGFLPGGRLVRRPGPSCSWSTRPVGMRVAFWRAAAAALATANRSPGRQMVPGL